jgi:elongator complex protein 3
MKKASRTISGVTPVAVMARPMGCPGKCVYCPTYSTAPQSYTPESPAVQRARLCNYDAKKQVELRLRVLTEMGHPTDKVELIVMGGTFLAAPEDYQYQFVKDCYDALNGMPSHNLQEAQLCNETAVNRCVGLCIETRPDWCNTGHIRRMLDFGTTRVEIGVQMLDDEVYRIVGRGHMVEDVIAATYRLKTYGFKVHYHWMPGLPGSNAEKDLALSQALFDDERFRPDGIKIYPTMVIQGTELERWFKEGKYQPYDNDVMTGLVADIKALVPKYVRISRVLRDIPPQYIVGGLKDSLREGVKDRLAQAGKSCRCIRCREFGHRTREGWVTGEPELVRLDYDASGGREIFLSFEDKNETLFGLLRLRVQSALEEGSGILQAIVRELHIYGPEVPINSRLTTGVQHRGLGRALLAEAENIAREEFGVRELAILSGVGARQYYAESGYRGVGAYMVKTL